MAGEATIQLEWMSTSFPHCVLALLLLCHEDEGLLQQSVTGQGSTARGGTLEWPEIRGLEQATFMRRKWAVVMKRTQAPTQTSVFICKVGPVIPAA